MSKKQKYWLTGLVLFWCCSATAGEGMQTIAGMDVPEVANHDTTDNNLHAVLAPMNLATLSSQADSYVDAVQVKEGDKFSKGQVLIKFDCVKPLAELQKAKAILAAEQSVNVSNQKLARLKAISHVELATGDAHLKEAQADYAIKTQDVQFCQVIAPFSGEVINVSVHPFETVKKGQPLLEIIDNRSLQVELLVPSEWLTWVSVNTPFVMSVKETNGRYLAKVVKILPKVDAVSRSVKLLGRLEKPSVELIAGMSGQVDFPQKALASIKD